MLPVWSGLWYRPLNYLLPNLQGGLCLLNGVRRPVKWGSGTDVLIRVSKRHNPPLCPSPHHVALISTKKLVEKACLWIPKLVLFSIHYFTTDGRHQRRTAP